MISIKENIANWFKHSKIKQTGHLDAIYVYAAKNLDNWSHAKLRIIKQNGEKTFRIITPDTLKSGNMKGKKDTELFYNTHLLTNCSPEQDIYITEGEKDADNLTKLDLLAIGTPGATSHKSLDYAPLVHAKHRSIILLPDNDDIGRQHMESIGLRLIDSGIPKEKLKIIEPSAYLLPEHADITDFIEHQQLTNGCQLESAILSFPFKQPPKARLLPCSTKLKTISLAEITAKEKSYIDDEDLLPRSELVIVVGNSGSGKSTNINDLAARVSNKGRKVMIYSTEENPQIIIKPSISAAGGNLNNILMLDGTEDDGEESYFSPSEHMPILRNAYIEHDIELLILDPVRNFIPEKEDTHTIGKYLQPIIEIAKELDICIVGIHHTGKLDGFRVGDWQRLLVGSVHWYSIPRTIYFTYKFSDEKRVFTCIKSDIKQPHGIYEYDIGSQEITIDGNQINARILVRGESLVDTSTEEVFSELDGGQARPKKKELAIEFLRRSFTASEIRPAKEVEELAAKSPEKISKPTLHRAMRELNFKTRKNLPDPKSQKPNQLFSWQAPENFKGVFDEENKKT